MLSGNMLKYSVFLEAEKLGDHIMCDPLFLHRLLEEPQKNEKAQACLQRKVVTCSYFGGLKCCIVFGRDAWKVRFCVTTEGS